MSVPIKPFAIPAPVTTQPTAIPPERDLARSGLDARASIAPTTRPGGQGLTQAPWPPLERLAEINSGGPEDAVGWDEEELWAGFRASVQPTIARLPSDEEIPPFSRPVAATRVANELRRRGVIEQHLSAHAQGSAYWRRLVWGTAHPPQLLGCPICGRPAEAFPIGGLYERYGRYPRMICDDCHQQVVDDSGEPVRICNRDFSGGVLVLGPDGQEKKGLTAFSVRGVRCRFDEHRFGGIVGKPLPDEPLERITGSLLAGAVGDALGRPIEFFSLGEIRHHFGPTGVVEYEPGGGDSGSISDDTQMTLFTAEGLLVARSQGAQSVSDYLPAIADAYRRWLATQTAGVVAPSVGWLSGLPQLHQRRAPGTTCLAALETGRPVLDSKGCGGVMRVAPIGLLFEEPFELACAAAGLTHGHPTGVLSAGAFAFLLAQLCHGEDPKRALEATLERLQIESGAGEVSGALIAASRLTHSGEPATAETVEQLGGGWVADEALAIALYCLLIGEDVPSGLLLAVNHGGDSDSTGSLAGQLFGAIHGPTALPWSLLEELECGAAIEQISRDLASAFMGAPTGTDWPARYRTPVA